MTNSPTRNIAEAALTLQINQAGWRKVCAKKVGSYADDQVAEALKLDSSTIYRVRTGRLAPGPKFIAASLTFFGVGAFSSLFEIVAATERAA